MRKQFLVFFALGATSVATAWVQGQAAPPAPPMPAAPAAQGAPATPAGMTSRFESGCAICHDNPQDPTSRAPTRETLRT